MDNELTRVKTGGSTINTMVISGFENRIVGLGDGLLQSIREGVKVEYLRKLISLMVLVGNIGIVTVMLLGFLTGLTMAIKSNSFNYFTMGFLWLICVPIGHYLCLKFMNANQRLIQDNPHLTPRTFLDCLAMVAFAGGIGALGYGIYFSIKTSDWMPIYMGLTGFLSIWLLAMVALHPSEVNIVDEDRTDVKGQMIGVITFFVKWILKTIPIVFCVSAIVGLVYFILAIIRIINGTDYAMAVSQAATYSMIALLLPVAGYLGTLAYYLVADLFHAILSLLDR